ncbi:hypothetical protein Hdeb2414_s0014g00435111 [Helianthus debilis subsp. tardiflorus]
MENPIKKHNHNDMCAFVIELCAFVIELLAYYNLFTGFKHQFILSMLAVLAQELRLYKFPVLDTDKGFSPFQVDCTEIVCDQPPKKFYPNDGDGLHMIFTKITSLPTHHFKQIISWMHSTSSYFFHGCILISFHKSRQVFYFE